MIEQEKTKSSPQTMAKVAVRHYIDTHVDVTDEIPSYDVYVVWFAYVLGNFKCLVSSTFTDGMYYEVTYNASKQELYVDAYKKFENVVHKIDTP